MECHYSFQEESRFEIILSTGSRIAVSDAWLPYSDMSGAFMEAVTAIDNHGTVTSSIAGRFMRQCSSNVIHHLNDLRRSGDYAVSSSGIAQMALVGLEVMKTSALANMAHMLIATRPTSQIFGSKQMRQLSGYFQLLTINRLQSALQNFNKANADGVLQASYFLKAMTDDELGTNSKYFPVAHALYVHVAARPQHRCGLNARDQIVDAMRGWADSSGMRPFFFDRAAGFRSARGLTPSPSINLARTCALLVPAVARLHAYQKLHEAKVEAAEILVKVMGLIEAGLPSPFAVHVMLRDMTSFSPAELTHAAHAKAPLLLAIAFHEVVWIVVDLACPDYSDLREVWRARTVCRLHDQIVEISKSDGRRSLEAISLSHIANYLAKELLERGTIGISTEPLTTIAPQDRIFAVRWADNPAKDYKHD